MLLIQFFQTMKFQKIEIITIAICIDSVIKIDEKSYP